ncbi:hypothetical protein TVAG_043990 [Trichomonas vaginalis G3]|uniref:Uncharacterized protein n=1 Tax=Trichomonas vaginalis (strain ATCC PRA-98 / G3) TaxID=412133 RepID=A2E0F9_TRIV3|nr:hypothetical protein TVAGG3_0541090 [Trichomonas vaginalis G3]EAY13839.1 hypothetical protein TVAG_043990 [Trichomonas vaginalis G3]KAI5519844.1 hypothetical protein TVAGG3_0541090 [Trichomonas vaginalis G3]|eukprot:XP_001326062.1 hypothetical protein [Trichomonas vaginalis G3]
MFSSWSWSGWHYLISCVFPFLISLLELIFICTQIDIDILPTEPINSIPVTMIFFKFLEGMAHFTVYYLGVEGPEQLFGDRNWLIIVILVIFAYPIYFLFKLPFVVIRIFLRLGSPGAIWERMFSNTGFSLEKLRIDDSNCPLFVFRCIYIGLPFIIFALIYVILIIALSPLWYFIFSCWSMGCFGIAATMAILYTEEDPLTAQDRCLRVHFNNQCIHLFTTASDIIFTAIHLALAHVSVIGVFLCVVASISFIFHAIYCVHEIYDRCNQRGTHCCSCCSKDDL